MPNEEQKYSESEVKQLIEQYEQELIASADKGVPQLSDKDTQLKFMRELKDTPDSKKIANLDNNELGNCKFTLRGCQQLNILADALGLPTQGGYWKSSGEIIASTSMSRKAKFLELIFTQIKKTTVSTDAKPLKKGFFSFGKPKEESENG